MKIMDEYTKELTYVSILYIIKPKRFKYASMLTIIKIEIYL